MATATASTMTAALLNSIVTTTTSASASTPAFSSSSMPGADGLWSSMPALAAHAPKRRDARSRRTSLRAAGAPSPAFRPIRAATAAALAAGGGGGALTSDDDEKSSGQGQGEGKVIHGKCFVVGDNIDTDQIIPAEYLTLVPSKPEEYEKLGSYAMIGLPAHYGKFIEAGNTKTEYTVMIGGANFGCGSSREHAPVAMGAAGIRAVVAESYARIFFRNSVATGELYPVESSARVCEETKTGDLVTVDMGNNVLINHTSGRQFSLIPIGDAGPVIDAGGIFNFARASGMIAATAPA